MVDGREFRLVNGCGKNHGYCRRMIEDRQAPPSKPRLRFIDLARAIAILLMLEGHFVGLTLADSSHVRGHPVYQVWNFLRGFSAPLFFTVAGMIFVYLLGGEKNGLFLRRIRVRKGLRRALELFFWGYLLQIDAGNWSGCLADGQDSWVYAFHVLQCIGAGLLLLILLAGLREAAGFGNLETWYAGAALLCMAAYVFLKHLPSGISWPPAWPALVQNAIQGPNSVFPLAPWLAYAFLGGAMGAYLRTHSAPDSWKSCVPFFGVAAVLQLICLAAGSLPLVPEAANAIGWFTQRAFQVVMFLGLLRWLEIRRGIGLEWLLRCGRETFSIYIAHVIVLYGGMFGVGLNDVWKKQFNGWQAASGALVFVGFFVVQAQLLQHWKSRKAGAAAV